MIKKTVLISVAMILWVAVSALAAEDAATSAASLELKTEAQQISYALGNKMGSGIKDSGMELDLELVLRGLRDAIEGNEPAMSEKDMMQAMGRFQQAMMALQRKRLAEKSQENQAEGKAFLDRNAKKEGVVVLPSGLQYKVITEGTGRTPTAGNTVKVNYRGTLIDGEQFDSSYDRGKPAQFKVSGVIKGWQEGLQLMKEGAKWELYVPSDLAYGDRGSGRQIAPGSTLIFEVELLEIVGE